MLLPEVAGGEDFQLVSFRRHRALAKATIGLGLKLVMVRQLAAVAAKTGH